MKLSFRLSFDDHSVQISLESTLLALVMFMVELVFSNLDSRNNTNFMFSSTDRYLFYVNERNTTLGHICQYRM